MKKVSKPSMLHTITHLYGTVTTPTQHTVPKHIPQLGTTYVRNQNSSNVNQSVRFFFCVPKHYWHEAIIMVPTNHPVPYVPKASKFAHTNGKYGARLLVSDDILGCLRRPQYRFFSWFSVCDWISVEQLNRSAATRSVCLLIFTIFAFKVLSMFSTLRYGFGLTVVEWNNLNL